MVNQPTKMSFFDKKLEKTNVLHFRLFYLNGNSEPMGALDMQQIGTSER